MMETKIIWIYWHQGFNDSPYLVKKCVDSWLRHNPTYTLKLLDRKSLKNYINMDDIYSFYNEENIGLAAISDIIRLRLLSKYGGVWVDATCFCMAPLDNWLSDELKKNSGFFCPTYRKNTSEKIIDNWFLASKTNCQIVSKFERKITDYFLSNELRFYSKSLLGRRLNRWTQKKSKRTNIWFSFFVMKIMRAMPYFYFHYMFSSLASKDEEFRKCLENMSKIDAHDCNFKHLDPFKDSEDDFIENIKRKKLPFLKLKKIWDGAPKGSKLYELLHSIDS